MSLDFQIREDILNGTLMPGEKLNISKLKKLYNIGLAPLRESLARLVNTGLITCEQNKGFSIAPISEEELIDIYGLSIHLEVYAISQAIDRGNADWEEEIVSSLYHLDKIEQSKKKPSYDEWSKANTRFHNALIDTCGDSVKELRDNLHLKAERYVRIAFGLAMAEFEVYNQEHHDIADAVLSKDKNLASKLITRHIEEGRDILIKEFRKKKEFS